MQGIPDDCEVEKTLVSDKWILEDASSHLFKNRGDANVDREHER